MSYILNQSNIQDLFTKKEFPNETKARVVPYTVREGIIYFIMGKEREYEPENKKKKKLRGKYNFIGGRHNEGEKIYETAVRELDEELLGVIKPTNKSCGLMTICEPNLVKRNKRYIFFVPYYGPCYAAHLEFNKRKAKRKCPKMLSDILGKEVKDIDSYAEIEELIIIPEYNINPSNKDLYHSVTDIFNHMYTPSGNLVHVEKYFDVLRESWYAKLM